MAEADVAEAVPSRVHQDSVSFFPYLARPNLPSMRDWVYADVFSGSFAGLPDANYTIRNERYKLLRHEGNEEFYDLGEDPYEHVDLLAGSLSAEQQAQYQLLKRQFDALRASESSEGRYTVTR
jgi:muramidase (phage lysozyme)